MLDDGVVRIIIDVYSIITIIFNRIIRNCIAVGILQVDSINIIILYGIARNSSVVGTIIKIVSIATITLYCVIVDVIVVLLLLLFSSLFFFFF